MAVNDRISQSRILLFLGAGASAPFGGWLMRDFIINLRSELYGKQEYLSSLLGTLIDYTDWDLEAILKELRDICEKRYFSDKSKINYINNFLDSEEEKKEREKSKLGGAGVPISYTGSIKEIPRFSGRYCELVEICKELRAFIETLIFEHYGNLDQSLIVQTYEPIFDILLELLGKDKILPIFTTNYDRVMEDYQKSEYKKVRLVDGIGEIIPGSRETNWNREVFDNFQVEEDKLNIVLFKLHGSIHWYESNKRIIYSSVSIHQSIKDRFKNVLIYPAMDKIAIMDPYFTGYDYFQRCLDNAEFAIFIGYSFRDYDTVTKIRSALNFNNKLTLIVLDPYAKELIAKNFSDLEKRFSSLGYSFGEKANIDKYLEQLKKALEK